MPGIRADIFLAISKTGMRFLTFIIFKKRFYYFGSQLAKVWKKKKIITFLKLDKISHGSE